MRIYHNSRRTRTYCRSSAPYPSLLCSPSPPYLEWTLVRTSQCSPSSSSPDWILVWQHAHVADPISEWLGTHFYRIFQRFISIFHHFSDQVWLYTWSLQLNSPAIHLPRVYPMDNRRRVLSATLGGTSQARFVGRKGATRPGCRRVLFYSSRGDHKLTGCWNLTVLKPW